MERQIDVAALSPPCRQEVTWEELDASARPPRRRPSRSRRGRPEQEDERGDSGTRYRLDEVAEVDEERFPSSVEVDENQEQLFPIEAETADRVTLGKVREMWTSP